MNYPEALLPKRGFVPNLDVDTLSEALPGLMVVRQVKGKIDDYLEEDENGEQVLNAEALKGNMARLSTNLLGGRYLYPEHLPFLAKANGEKQWNGEDVDLSEYGEEDYTETPECFGLAFRLSEVKKLQFPYTASFNKEGEWKAAKADVEQIAKERDIEETEKLIGPYVKKQVTEMQGYVQIKHEPSMLNYWHTTVNATLGNKRDLIDSSNQKGAERRALEGFRQSLRFKAIWKDPKFDQLEESKYLLKGGV